MRARAPAPRPRLKGGGPAGGPAPRRPPGTGRSRPGGGEIVLRAPAELDAIRAALGVEGRALEPLHLLGLSSFLASVDATATGIRRSRAAFPRPGAIVETPGSFQPEPADGRRKVEPSAQV